MRCIAKTHDENLKELSCWIEMQRLSAKELFEIKKENRKIMLKLKKEWRTKVGIGVFLNPIFIPKKPSTMKQKRAAAMLKNKK